MLRLPDNGRSIRPKTARCLLSFISFRFIYPFDMNANRQSTQHKHIQFGFGFGFQLNGNRSQLLCRITFKCAAIFNDFNHSFFVGVYVWLLLPLIFNSIFLSLPKCVRVCVCLFILDYSPFYVYLICVVCVHNEMK